MSSDRSAVAFERIALSQPSPVSEERAGWGDPARAVAPSCDLAELASALAQAEALVAACADHSPDAAAALDRIADIAFVLHEREVEPSLCDALDAAMREISEAHARNRANVQRAHEAAELLRGVGRRLDAMIAAQAQPQAPGMAAVDSGELECADEFPAPARLFESEVAHDTGFAQTVAALADSLPRPGGATPAQCPDHLPPVDGAASEPLPHSDVVAEQTDSAEAPSRAGEDGAPDDDAGAMAAAASSSDPAAIANHVSLVAAAAAPIVEAIDPDDDPGDLFEPMHGESAADTSASLPMMSAAAKEPAAAIGIAPQPSLEAAAALTSVGSRSAANDPLALIRALSEEELIALFS